MTIIVVAASKGGTAKTTTAVSLASGLAHFAPTLLVDCDPQGHCSVSFDLPIQSGLHDWLVKGELLAKCLQQARPADLRILPGDNYNKIVDDLYHARPRELMDALRRLDENKGSFVVFDTPAYGVLQEAPIAVADQVIIPFRCEAYSMESTFATLDMVDAIAPDSHRILLPVAFDQRLREHRLNFASLSTTLRDLYHYTLIPELAIKNRVTVMEAQSSGRTIWEYRAPGLVDVRRGYSFLIAHVLRQAGLTISDSEIYERIVNGKESRL